MTTTPATQADAEFTRGYLVAVSNLIGGHGAGVETDELLRAINATPKMIRSLDLAEYDITNLKEGLRHARG